MCARLHSFFPLALCLSLRTLVAQIYILFSKVISPFSCLTCPDTTVDSSLYRYILGHSLFVVTAAQHHHYHISPITTRSTLYRNACFASLHLAVALVSVRNAHRYSSFCITVYVLLLYATRSRTEAQSTRDHHLYTYLAADFCEYIYICACCILLCTYSAGCIA